VSRNLAITLSALVLLLVSVLFDKTGSFAGVVSTSGDGEAAAKTERLALLEPANRLAMGNFGSEVDRLEDPVEPEPDEGLAEDKAMPQSLQAFGSVDHLADVPPPLRGTINNVPRIE
jgi:hypothetical protein